MYQFCFISLNKKPNELWISCQNCQNSKVYRKDFLIFFFVGPGSPGHKNAIATVAVVGALWEEYIGSLVSKAASSQELCNRPSGEIVVISRIAPASLIRQK
jgi:hypothetical protein